VQIAIRPYVTTGVAIVGATALLVAPLTVTPQDVQVPAVPTVAMAVQPASLVTDLLDSWQTLFDAVGTSLGGGLVNLPGVPVPIGDPGLFPFIGGFPAQTLALIQNVIDGNVSIPAALSTLIYGLAYPLPVVVGVVPPGIPVLATASLLSILATPIAAAIADILPDALSGPFLQAFSALGDVVVRVLSILPTPLPPFPQPAAMALTAKIAPQPTGIQAVLAALQQSAQGTATLLGSLPDELVTLGKLVINNPSLLPGAISTLANGLLSPNPKVPSLFNVALGPLINVVLSQPSPIGGADGVATKVVTALGQVITGVLKNLPAPLPPQKAAIATLSLTGGKDQPEGLGALPNLHRPVLKLNIKRDNLSAADKTDDAQDGAKAPGTGLANHRLGAGKVSVRDVIKRVTGHDNAKLKAKDKAGATA
jgi:hypothetical protein